jgi:uncharacterized C2H2 Zn-finger protein
VQLAKLDKLVDELLKKLSLQQFDCNKSIQQHDSTLDSEDKLRSEDFAIETKLKPIEEFDFKSEPNCNITITEEITESAIEIKEEFPNDPFASLEIFNNSVVVESDIMLEENRESNKSFVCDTCDANFKQKSDCISHIATFHEGKKPLTRKPCTSDKVHEENGESDKNFLCDTCDASFKQKSDCISHIATIHEGKKPFKCDECGHRFAQRSILNAHITIHERKKSFKCDECGATFTQKSSLKIHITSIHERKKPFKCDECGGTFTQKSSLNAQIKAIHDGFKERHYFNCSLPSCNYHAPKGFYGFPKNEKMRKKWQRLCGMKEVKKCDRLCFQHFEKSQLGIPKTSNSQPRLKLGALPSLSLPNQIFYKSSTWKKQKFGTISEKNIKKETVTEEDPINMVQHPVSITMGPPMPITESENSVRTCVKL